MRPVHMLLPLLLMLLSACDTPATQIIATPQNPLIFADDFEANTSLWELPAISGNTSRVEDGAYVIEMTTSVQSLGWYTAPIQDGWETVPRAETDFTLEFDVRDITSSTDNACVVILFAVQTDYSDFQRLSYCADGSWALVYHSGQAQQVWGRGSAYLNADAGELIFSDYPNILDIPDLKFRLEVTADTIALWVNDHAIAVIDNQDPIAGTFGFGLLRTHELQPSLGTTSDLYAEFDNFVVRHARAD